MISPYAFIKATSVGLAAFELLLLALRFVHAASKVELLWFALVLLLATATGYMPFTELSLGLYLLAVLWAAGMYVSYLTVGTRTWIWQAAIAAMLLVVALVRLIGLAETLPFYLLFFFFFSLLSLYPLVLLVRLYKGNRHPLLLLYAIAMALMLAAMGYDFLSLGTALPWLDSGVFAGLFYLIASGLLLAQESYLQGMSWHSLQIRLGAQEKRLRQAYSRLIQTENTLLLQDRLILTGVLAAGAAHEFKNTIASIQTSAGFGLKKRTKQAMHQALQLVLEQAQCGRQAVTEFLDHLLQRGRERPGIVFLKDDLQGLLGLARTSCRREGVHLAVEIAGELKLQVRRGELEQVLLNLIRNALDSIREKGLDAAGNRHIKIKAYDAESTVVLDVMDSGGGVPEELQNQIFELSFSEKRSTGLGLFLTRALVERNGGSLTYVPLADGSCFHAVFPAA
jgi:signal transduction histidine kinase